MKVAIITLDQGRAIAFPQIVLDQIDLRDEAEVTVVDGAIVVRPATSDRSN